MTDKVRIDVLKEAKRIVNNSEFPFICSAIDEALMYFGGLEICEDVFKRISRLFPELRRHKPKGRVWGEYWWDISNKNPRIKVLNSMIKEIKAKSND